LCSFLKFRIFFCVVLGRRAAAVAGEKETAAATAAKGRRPADVAKLV
jgi:hypothetical protein